MTEKLSKEKQSKKPSPWTPDMVKEIMAGFTNFADRLADRYVRFKGTEFNHSAKLHEQEAKASRLVLGSLLVFLTIVVGLMAWLTFNNKVSGDALLFLTGIIAGYVLSMVQRQLFPPIIEIPKEEIE